MYITSPLFLIFYHPIINTQVVNVYSGRFEFFEQADKGDILSKASYQ